MSLETGTFMESMVPPVCKYEQSNRQVSIKQPVDTDNISYWKKINLFPHAS